jgi:predicted protein tyrosine phosphatase
MASPRIRFGAILLVHLAGDRDEDESLTMPERLHYLFVCHANVDRSPTAEAVCRRIALENGLEIEASSAGMSRRAVRPVTKEIADLADKVFVMEPDMVREMILEYGQNPAKIVCLDVPDIYERDEPRLVSTLEQKLYDYLIREELI